MGHLKYIYPEFSSPEEAAILWESLASLQHLRTLHIITTRWSDEDSVECVYFYEAVSLLTNISALDMYLGPESWEKIHREDHVPSVFSTLTQLTAIDCSEIYSSVGFLAILNLPNLESLCLPTDPDPSVVSMNIAAPKLSKLRCCCHGKPLETFLVPESPALSSLQTLEVVQSELTTFPMCMAAKLTRLVKLDLSDNSFDRLPHCIAAMFALQELDFSENENLQLQKGGPAILAALTNLKALNLRKRYGNWSNLSMQTVILITRVLPSLVVSLE